MSQRIRVGVIRGGPSAEHEVSLATGAAILRVLDEILQDKYESKDILVDRTGKWFLEGNAITPENSIHHLDVIWNALHGTYGEDGKIQKILELHNLPFTGSGSLSSAVGMNKIMAKKLLALHSIKSPYWNEIESSIIKNDAETVAIKLFKTFTLPAVVKPTSNGSSVGVSVVRTFADLAVALKLAASYGDSVLIEEYIPGVEATCGVIEGYRGEELYALPPIEIIPKYDFFDYEAKYGGSSHEIVPGRFSREVTIELEKLSREIHKLLQLRHYSRSDFIVHPRRGIYFLETNTLPGLTNESLVPKALRSVGSNLAHFVDHILQLSIGK